MGSNINGSSFAETMRGIPAMQNLPAGGKFGDLFPGPFQDIFPEDGDHSGPQEDPTSPDTGPSIEPDAYVPPANETQAAASAAAGGAGALSQRGSGSGSRNSAKQGLRLRGGY